MWIQVAFHAGVSSLILIRLSWFGSVDLLSFAGDLTIFQPLWLLLCICKYCSLCNYISLLCVDFAWLLDLSGWKLLSSVISVWTVGLILSFWVTRGLVNLLWCYQILRYSTELPKLICLSWLVRCLIWGISWRQPPVHALQKSRAARVDFLAR